MPKASDHAHHFIDVLQLKERGNVDVFVRFSTEIDKYDYANEFLVGIEDNNRKPFIITPANHRQFFHWGYSIPPSKVKRLQDYIAANWDFHKYQITDINGALFRAQVSRNKKLIRISQQAFKNRRKSSAMSAILYNLHILADYFPNHPTTGVPVNSKTDQEYGLMNIDHLYGEFINSIRKAFGDEETKDLVKEMKKLNGKQDVYECQRLLEANLPYFVYFSFGPEVSSLTPDEIVLSPIGAKLMAKAAEKAAEKAIKEAKKAVIRKVITGGFF